MSRLMNMSILLIVVFAATMFRSTVAIDHIVGSTNGWIIPVGGHSFYSDWASNITFKENDVLVFNFVIGHHTVAEVNQANFENCNLNQNIEVFDTSPVRFTLNRTGVFYFTCSIPGHCASGQKLRVNVSASSQGPSPPSPAPLVSENTPTSSVSGDIYHIVGSTNGWIIPVGGHSFYSDWASNITFKENDVLVFKFVMGHHTVAEVNQANFENCNLNQNIKVFDTSPVRFTLNRTGVFYFTCSIPGHCASGQKLSVNVFTSSPTSSQGPSPTTSSDNGDTHTIVAMFPILIAAVVVNFLF